MTGASGAVSVINIGSATEKINTIYAHDVKVDAGSLYINDKKVIEDVSDTITIRTDTDQDIAVKTFGTGDINLISEHTVNLQGRGGIEIGVPSNLASKNLTLSNAGTGGDISLSASGELSNIELLAYDKVNVIAETFDMNADLEVTGGVTTTIGYQVGGSGPTGYFLRGDGIKFTASLIQAGDVPAGNIGPTGPQGVTGPQGNQGIQGTTGSQGSQGPQPTVTGTAGEALSLYDLVYSDPTDSGKYKKSLSNGTSTQAECVGIVTQSGGISNGSSGEITLLGKVTNQSWSWTAGSMLYLDSTPGSVTQTEPSTFGYYVKPIGYATGITDIFFQVGTGWRIGSASISVAGPLVRSVVGGRIDRSSDTVLTWTPVIDSGIGLWNGYEWRLVTPSSSPTLSNTANDLDSAALTYDYNYDIFAEWYDELSFNLVAKKWTNDLTRSQSLSRYQGVYVYDATTDSGRKRRFLGTVRLRNDTTSKFSDDNGKRFVSNFYNRKSVDVISYNTGTAWSYNGGWRESQGGTNQVRGYLVLCQSLIGEVSGVSQVSWGSADGQISVGIDSTTSPTSPRSPGWSGNVACPYCGSPQLVEGYHYFTTLEYSTGNVTFCGTSGSDRHRAILRFES
jgi:hypothetical protein